ncbi:hypothetical protein pipiens_001743 [Culex pipiens pipiens]|uniref:Uncharacterized protein n=1 Tax=Culex pipiens pipiens TaxID=38569 RepID=A0ABD1DX51_CULPP
MLRRLGSSQVAFLIVALLPLLVQPKPATTALDDVEIVEVVPATKDDAMARADLLRAKRSGFNLVSGLKSEDSHFDGWSLKKSILNTLFQAVKAITGGVTILKGQLIKGSGYAISGLGKVVASGGDAVSNVGKKITSSAHLVPAPSHSSVIHPFAKLSGSLSSGSSSLISSASSSSSGGSSSSSSSSGHHTGPSSESFTSYEGPSSYDTHSSSHSYIPPKQSAHYKAPLTSYGTEIESDVYSSAPHHHHYTLPGKTTSVVEASDVLRQILNQKVPSHNSPSTSTGYSYNSYHHATGPMKYEKQPKATPISQYDIPNDPFPPPFKPLKNSNNAYLPPLYGAPHGPIESVTHSQSVVTAFGAPFNGGQYHVESESEPQYPPSYDIYRSMSVKMAGKKEKIVTHQSHSSHPDPRSKVTSYTTSTNSLSSYLSPPKPTALTRDQKQRFRDDHHSSDDDHHSVHEQQLHDLSQKFGPGIEVQKSLTFEITDPVDVAGLTQHIASHDLERRSDDKDGHLKPPTTTTASTSASSSSSDQTKKTAT